MKNFKKTIALGLAAMAAVSAMSMTALAEEVDTTNTINNVTSTVDTGITPFSYGYPVNVRWVTGNPVNKRFIMDEAEPLGKVWVENSGSSNITVTVTKKSQNGTRIKNTATGKRTLTISPGKQGRFYFTAEGYDSNGESVYYVNLGTSTGETVSANLGVRSANHESELGE